MNILLTSVGRRVELVRLFRRALGDKGEVHATDMDSTAPGLYAAHNAVLAPRVGSGKYVPTLVDFCRRNRVAAVVPLIDTELPVLARARAEFQEIGTEVLVGEPNIVDTCGDKLATARFFARLGVPAPATYANPSCVVCRPTSDSGPAGRRTTVVKPRCGSAGKGIHVCTTREEMEYWFEHTEDALIQQYVVGAEVTTDVLSDLDGVPLCQVQRKRLKTRGGEVERGITIADAAIAAHIQRIAEALRAPGVINVQCFLTDNGPLFTEINPRFGGGYPLAHAAGAAFPERIVSMLEHKVGRSGGHREGTNRPFPDPRPSFPGYRTGVVMMRFDEAVYREEKELI
jgi:carbamoyl-phosphate synthase large subunit